MKECYMCHEVKPFECFNKNKSRKDGYEFRCKECRKKVYQDDFSSPKGRASILRKNCVKRSKENGFETVTVTVEWITKRIEEGCPLTGIAFNLSDVNSPYAPSLDRIDSSKGYTLDNCRVIIAMANYAKNIWSDDELYIFAEKLLLKRS